MDFSGIKWEAWGQAITIFLMTGSLLVALLPSVHSLASGLPCCVGSNVCGTKLVLRFSIVFVLYLLFCSVLELIRSVRSQSSYWFWFAKAFVIVSGCWAAVYIPPPSFDRTWADCLLFGAMIFIVAQVYVLVRLSYVVIIKLHRMVENGSELAKRLQIILFTFGVITPILSEMLLLYYYPLCGLNLVFLITNAAIPFIACLWSMSDCVKATNGYSGFAQGGMFACFIIFFTWSALSSHPNPKCNPYFGSTGIIIFRQCLFIITSHIVYVVSVFFTYNIFVEEIEEPIIPETEEERINSPRKTKHVIREDIVHVYSPKFNSFLCASLMCFVVMSLLNWASSADPVDIEKESKTAMWFKLVGCWFSVLFFVVTLYTPSLYGIFPRKYR